MHRMISEVFIAFGAATLLSMGLYLLVQLAKED
jgi:hypothetical protein